MTTLGWAWAYGIPTAALMCLATMARELLRARLGKRAHPNLGARTVAYGVIGVLLWPAVAVAVVVLIGADLVRVLRRRLLAAPADSDADPSNRPP